MDEALAGSKRIQESEWEKGFPIGNHHDSERAAVRCTTWRNFWADIAQILTFFTGVGIWGWRSEALTTQTSMTRRCLVLSNVRNNFNARICDITSRLRSNDLNGIVQITALKKT